MNIPSKPNQSKSDLPVIPDEREIWHKLVIKVIRWKDEPVVGGNFTAKITSKEWDTYAKSIVQINTTNEKQKFLADLQETKDLIQKHGGFE
jgi:hypothetical protein